MKKQRLLALFLLLLSFIPCLQAQKKELGQARSYIKSGKDYDKAEKLMTDLLQKDSTCHTNEKVYLMWFTSVLKQYEAANEKLYLKQKYDTAAFFGLTHRLYAIAESLDSIDVAEHGGKKPRLKYREGHARLLNQLRPNLYFGGTYHVGKGNYKEAIRFFETYLEADNQPLFQGYNYSSKDSRMPQAAYWAVYSAYKLNDADKVLRYAPMAMADTAKTAYTLLHVAEAYEWQRNDSAYLATLDEGFVRFPEHPYFFPHLEDYYTGNGNFEMALKYAERALEVNPQNTIFQLAKATSLLNLERYDESVRISERLIADCDTMPEPYYTIGSAYLNQALTMETGVKARDNKTKIREFYIKARPYMEAYRKLSPNEKKKWAPALYRIYLNLNMGKQFEEIDHLMHD